MSLDAAAAVLQQMQLLLLLLAGVAFVWLGQGLYRMLLRADAQTSRGLRGTVAGIGMLLLGAGLGLVVWVAMQRSAQPAYQPWLQHERRMHAPQQETSPSDQSRSGSWWRWWD